MFDRVAYMKEYGRNRKDKEVRKRQNAAWQKAHPERCRSYWTKTNVRYSINHPSRVNWSSMMNRCYNVNVPNYKDYGAKGVKVYPPWHTFLIYEKEFGHTKPAKGYTVDRINNEGDYEPGNVQWLTKSDNLKKRHTSLSRSKQAHEKLELAESE